MKDMDMNILEEQSENSSVIYIYYIKYVIKIGLSPYFYTNNYNRQI